MVNNEEKVETILGYGYRVVDKGEDFGSERYTLVSPHEFTSDYDGDEVDVSYLDDATLKELYLDVAHKECIVAW